MTTEIVIVSAARTAVGKFGGTLAKTPAPELGAAVIKALLERSGVAADQVAEVILGQVLQAGAGQNPARQSVIKSGLPQSVPAMTINAVCGSGLKAVMLAAQSIRDGDSEIVIAGGQESMSLAPHVLPGSRDGQRMGDWKLVDSMITDGLWDVYNQYHMGITAENVAKKYGITREQQDALALASQQKATAAQEAGRPRPAGDQRSVRRAGLRRQQGNGLGYVEDQRERRRDRAGSSDRRVRRARAGDAVARNGPTQRAQGARIAVHRRRHGRGARRRALAHGRGPLRPIQDHGVPDPTPGGRPSWQLTASRS
jgi:hypothetical protein